MTEKNAKGAYKPTGNIAVDTVAACIWHYQRQGKRLKHITLDGIYWTMFTGFVVEKIPMYDLDDGYVDFDGVKVMLGSKLQVKNVDWEFEKDNGNVFTLN